MHGYVALAISEQDNVKVIVEDGKNTELTIPFNTTYESLLGCLHAKRYATTSRRSYINNI